jgi:hypothetical protein
MTALWVVFALFTIGLVGMFLVAFRVEKRARLFHLYVIAWACILDV